MVIQYTNLNRVDLDIYYDEIQGLTQKFLECISFLGALW
jgi:hypothetical protein